MLLLMWFEWLQCYHLSGMNGYMHYSVVAKVWFVAMKCFGSQPTGKFSQRSAVSKVWVVVKVLLCSCTMCFGWMVAHCYAVASIIWVVTKVFWLLSSCYGPLGCWQGVVMWLLRWFEYFFYHVAMPPSSLYNLDMSQVTPWMKACNIFFSFSFFFSRNYTEFLAFV